MGFRLNKAQVAMEFVMLIMIAFMIMIVFTAFAKDSMIDIRKDEEGDALKDVVESVKSEILIASNVEDGYRRDFTIPDSVRGINYTIEISYGYINAESRNYEYSVQVPPTVGIIVKGENTIRREEGVVYLNA
ncbi:hypothetical protein JW707_03170 [Candidatus Woesearchaeota archaeon]|nr:hypothetical protein [Candidatus Woesearchaeota archaeon]